MKNNYQNPHENNHNDNYWSTIYNHSKHSGRRENIMKDIYDNFEVFYRLIDGKQSLTSDMSSVAYGFAGNGKSI